MATREDRFWRKVNKNGPIHPILGTPCWLWKGGKNKDGYGWFHDDGPQLAHRVAWQLQRGAIPRGHSVLHKCDRPDCVNGAHLFTGKQADNVRDMVVKGRHRASSGSSNGAHTKPESVLRGEKHRNAKLTEEQVREILRRSDESSRRIAREYGVNKSLILSIRHGRAWAHIGADHGD